MGAILNPKLCVTGYIGYVFAVRKPPRAATPMGNQELKGLVIRVTGSEVWVDTDAGAIACAMRGKLRQADRGFRIVAGDRVTITADESAGVIEAVDDRDNWLSRYVERDATERFMAANLDRLYLVVSIKQPPLHLGFVDRVLASAEHGRVPSAIIVNKIDLVDAAKVDQFADLYQSVGYPVHRTSAETRAGIESLESELADGLYAFVGPSGVGKSSLLMGLDPSLDLRVNTVGQKTRRGRHTTTHSQLYPFRGGFLVDTPGVQTFGYAGADEFALAACFPDLAKHVDACKFSPCAHKHEPQCGVRDAVAAGDIAESRYRSYLALFDDVVERNKRLKKWD